MRVSTGNTESKHIIHLYTPTVNKYTIQAQFISSGRNDDRTIYITSDNSNSLFEKKIKEMGLDVSIIKPEDIINIKKSHTSHIIVDAGSIDSSVDHIGREKYLRKLSKSHNILCTYDITKLSPEILKQLVDSHDKLVLTTNDMIMESPSSNEHIEIESEVIERFVKN